MASIEGRIEIPPAVNSLLSTPSSNQSVLWALEPPTEREYEPRVETSLLGLPDSVAVGVLEDWLSDLRGEDPDPDPQSDVSTPLNARIASQVDRLGIPRNRLPQEWQTRLERYLR